MPPRLRILYQQVGVLKESALFMRYVERAKRFLKLLTASLVTGVTRALGNDERGLCHHLRGLGHGLNRQFPEAIADFDAALEIYRKSRQKGLVVAALNEIGGAKRLINDYNGAEHDCKEALEMMKALLVVTEIWKSR